MHTLARLLIPSDPLLQLPPKPTGFDALYAADREWREDRLAERVEQRLRGTRFGDLFARGEAERPVHVGVGWTEGNESPALVIQLEGPIWLPMAESVARELSAGAEVRVRGVTIAGGDSSPVSVRASSTSRWRRGNEVGRKDTRDAASSRAQRKFRSSTGIDAEAVAEWLLEDDSVALVSSLSYRPCFSARVQPLVERIVAGATASWMEHGGADALRVQDDAGTQITTLTEAERAELTAWIPPSTAS